MSYREYRPEIDGLRALAVLAVVLFHTHVPGFSGGFTGVDIFFVISGFLITSILRRELQEGNFSVARFYERRVRRIFPALFLVLAATLGLACWLQLPVELSNTGTSLVATALFFANYHFMGDTGYFATAAHNKPLLHMWSLAVEEQYYVVFPLLLAALWRWRPRHLRPALALLTLASFLYAVILVQRSPDAAYYSAPARAWQLMIGSMLALTHIQPPRSAAAADAAGGIALALVLLPVALYDQSTPFPGWAALAPTLGTALLLWSSQQVGGVQAVLRWPPLRGIGLVSFSLYLWHWPVLLFHNAWSGRPPSAPETAFLLSLTVLLAWASWRWVEQPFRQWKVKRSVVLAAGLASMLAASAAGIGLRHWQGWPQRFEPSEHRVLAARNDAPRLRDCIDIGPQLRRCALGAVGVVPSFVLWGDSHAEAISPALDAAALSRGQAGWLLTRGGCPPLVGVAQTREGFTDCAESATTALDWIAGQSGVRQVWLAARWALYWSGNRFLREPGPKVEISDGQLPADPAAVFGRGLQRTLQLLHGRPGLEVVWISQVPELEVRAPEVMARAAYLGRRIDSAPTSSSYVDRQAGVQSLLSRTPEAAGIRRFEPAAWLCEGHRCAVERDGQPLYRDTNHLTASAAAALAPGVASLLAP